MGCGERSSRTALEGFSAAPIKIQGVLAVDLGIPLLGSTREKHVPVTQSVVSDFHCLTSAHPRLHVWKVHLLLYVVGGTLCWWGNGNTKLLKYLIKVTKNVSSLLFWSLFLTELCIFCLLRELSWKKIYQLTLKLYIVSISFFYNKNCLKTGQHPLIFFM